MQTRLSRNFIDVVRLLQVKYEHITKTFCNTAFLWSFHPSIFTGVFGNQDTSEEYVKQSNSCFVLEAIVVWSLTFYFNVS